MDQQFKEKPLTAFYVLLWKSLLFIVAIALLISAPFFWVLSSTFNSVLGVNGFKELTKILGSQATTSEEFLKQSELLKSFLENHPGIMSMFFFGILLGFVLICYLVYITHNYVKQVHMLKESNWALILKPQAEFLKVSLFLLLIGSMAFFSSGFFRCVIG